MKTIIINADVLENQKIEKILQTNNQLNYEFYSLNSIREGYELLKNQTADLIIIDINSCDETCNRFLRKIKLKTFEIVFLTDLPIPEKIKKSDEDITFISRPISAKDFVKLIAKIKIRVTQNLFIVPIEKEIIPAKDKLILKENDGIRFVNIDQIYRCKSDNNYTEIHLISGERILSSKTLKSFETKLIPYGFYRIHQSHLVDIEKIKKIISKDGLFVKLENNCMVELSRRRKNKLIKEMTGQF